MFRADWRAFGAVLRPNWGFRRDVALRLQTDEPNIGALLFTAEKAREYEEEVFRRLCGNFDIVLDHCSRFFQLYATPHAPCNVLY